ncbi:MAG: glycosyltransferase family 4 protein, partial [Acidobacteriota bacterium]
MSLRVAQISAGAAGMYCGSCMHANTVARTLIDQGHEVALIPTYTPLRTDEARVVTGERVFFSAINVYLQEKIPFFRHAPRWVDRLFESRPLLRMLSKMDAAGTDGRDIASLTLSVLQGADGHQAKELDKLVEWLETDYRPDVVQLAFAFFLGFAGPIKQRLGVPILCLLQGEDLTLDDMPADGRAAVVAAMREKARDVDRFLAPNAYYADAMADLLDVPRARFGIAPLGVDPADFFVDDPDGAHGAADGASSTEQRGAEDRRAADPARADGALQIGFLGRRCPEKGLHLLTAAFERLAADHPTLRLRIAGYLSKRDHAYNNDLLAQLDRAGLSERVDVVGEVDRAGKVDFLHSLDLFALPTVYREPKGLSVIEAMACGVPVVQPDHGSFPEMLADDGGGVLVAPDDAGALAAGVDALL